MRAASLGVLQIRQLREVKPQNLLVVSMESRIFWKPMPSKLYWVRWTLRCDLEYVLVQLGLH